MSTIVLLGAGGLTGRLTALELVRRGHRPILAAPAASALRARLSEHVRGDALDDLPIREVEPEVPEALDELLTPADLVVDLAGPYEGRGGVVVEAALRTGTHHVAAALEPAFVASVEARHTRLRDAGCVSVPAAGFPGGLLDLLADMALDGSGAEEVHLATTFPGRGGLRAGAGAGTRAVLAGLLARRMTARDGGGPVEEPIAEARRLAWFPRPVGLAHAAGVPGTAHLTVPRRHPVVRTVREYLALSSWRAEVLQLAGNAARFAWARARLDRLVRGTGVEPSPSRRARVRWACVAETRSSQGVVRAWANGHDPAATAAATVVVAGEAVLAGQAAGRLEPGMRAPSELAPAGELLDVLSARHELRWSVIRPG